MQYSPLWHVRALESPYSQLSYLSTVHTSAHILQYNRR